MGNLDEVAVLVGGGVGGLRRLAAVDDFDLWYLFDDQLCSGRE